MELLTFSKSLKQEFSHSISGKLFKEVIYNCSLENLHENTKVKNEALLTKRMKNTVVIFSIQEVSGVARFV